MAKLAGFDAERLRRTLWNLYWRSTAAVRERIEGELEPEVNAAAKLQLDPASVLDEVEDFVWLVRSGAYMGGDRRIKPNERSRWRLTFRRLAGEAQEALLAPDGLEPGARALEQMIDLACAMRERDYVHSEDPVEAAKFVVSDAVDALWGVLFARYGFAEFARRAAPQLIRWESRNGWTRHGWGKVSEKEVSLGSLLARVLKIPDNWVSFTNQYLAALDELARSEPGDAMRRDGHKDWAQRQRAKALAGWHDMLLERLLTYGADEQLDRLIRHPALAGAELTLLQARLADHRGDRESARDLVHKGLLEQPGHRQLLDFALDIGAPFPERAQQLMSQRR